MSHKEFPKWKYGKSDSVIVESEEAEAALGDGWYNSPAELKDAQDAKAKQIDDELRASRIAGGPAPVAGLPTGVVDLPADREALKAVADKLGITYPANIPSAKLEELVKAEIEKQGE